MQIVRVDVIPSEIRLRLPFRSVYHAQTDQITAVFLRIETRQSLVAWGCAVVDPTADGAAREQIIQLCQACADRARDLNPLNLEYALSELATMTEGAPSVQCAFDIAFHDLLGLAAGLPLHRLLGGFRDRILTSITINIGSVAETAELARDRARQGFRILKIKGGADPGLDVQRVRSVHRALPACALRLDADQGYTVQQAVDVAKALGGIIEMLEQPTPASDLEALRQVTEHSSIPILADESVSGPSSALRIAADRAADGMSVKLTSCGGLRCAKQVDAIGRSAGLATMVGCVTEPALLTAAGLAFALSSPNVRYGDLDGHIDLEGDPSSPRFRLHEGWLIASDVPGLGCTVEL